MRWWVPFFLLVAAREANAAEPRVASRAEQPSTAGANRTRRDGVPLQTAESDGSYALGFEMGRQIRSSHADVDPETVAAGVRDALAERQPLLTEEEMRAALSDLQVARKRKIARLRKTGLADNRRLGEDFLAANKLKEGVTTLPSGLQYRIVKPGNGRIPAVDDTVVCHFRGSLVTGEEFDNSYARGRPATIPVKRVIQGWAEALQLMPVGSKWQLFVPAALAYGDRGVGDLIGPGSTLVFDVELLSIAEKR